MKRALLLGVGLLVLPCVAEAQLEVGFDAGVAVRRQPGSDQTTFSVPSGWLRVGFPGETISFESLMEVTVLRAFGQTASLVRLLPGIAYNYRPNAYFRGEVGMLLLNQPGSSASQFALGIATGTKRQLGPGPLYLRLEVGLDRWLPSSDFRKSSEFRGVVGLSVVIN